MANLELRDINKTEEVVGIQISPEGHRIWVCVDGQCVLRIKNPSGKVQLTDMRKKVRHAKT